MAANIIKHFYDAIKTPVQDFSMLFQACCRIINQKFSQSISFTNLSGMSLTFTCLKNALHSQKTVNTDNRYFFSLERFGWCKIKNCMKSMKIKIPWWNLLRMGLSLFIENQQCFAKEQEFVFYITAVDVRWWPCQAQRLALVLTHFLDVAQQVKLSLTWERLIMFDWALCTSSRLLLFYCSL